jgi:glycosyltransferase involved in cell wall biosynthesis
MKILIINHYAIPPVESGGTRHYSLAKELIAGGHQVHIAAANFSHQTKTAIVKNEEVIFEKTYDGVPFIFVNVPHYQGNSPARLKNMLMFAKQLLCSPYFKRMEPPDVVIGSSPHPLAAWAAQRMAARWKVPFIFEVRDLWPQSLIDLGRISPRHPVVRMLARLERYLYQRADKIVTLLPGAAQYIASMGIDSGKVAWIPNGIDFSLYNKDLPKLKNDRFTVMYAGAHGLANGLDTVIRCAEILNKDYGDKILFRLVGNGPEKEKLKELAADLQLSNIQFDDPVPKCQIPEVLSQADAFVVVVKDSPLYKYGISLNKIYDYLVSARPVLIGVNAYNNPVAEADAGVTVPPVDPKELAKAVKTLYHMSDEERERMGLNGRKYVEEKHHFRTLASKLEKVLLEAIANHNK